MSNKAWRIIIGSSLVIAGVSAMVVGLISVVRSLKIIFDVYLPASAYESKVWDVYVKSPLANDAKKLFSSFAVKVNKNTYIITSALPCVSTLALVSQGDIYRQTVYLQNKKHGIITTKVEAIIENELCIFGAPAGIDAFSLGDEELAGKREHLVLTGPAHPSVLNGNTNKIVLSSSTTKIVSPIIDTPPIIFVGSPTYYPDKILSLTDVMHITRGTNIIHYSHCLKNGWEIVTYFDPVLKIELLYCLLNKPHVSYSRGALLTEDLGLPIINKSRDVVGLVYVMTAPNDKSSPDHWIVSISAKRIKELLSK